MMAKRYRWYTNSTMADYEGTIEEFVVWLFNGRCVTCKKVGTEISHIIPKGRGREYKNDWRNMVLQCKDCHVPVYHHNGVTDEKIVELQEARKNFLIALGRERFV